MNVLVVHNSYKQVGGEDFVVSAEASLLANAGHTIAVAKVSNDRISGLGEKIAVFLNTPHAASRKGWIRGLIEQTGAEVVHVHNFFPLLTPAVHEEAAALGVAVVQTLHNYRLLCASATFLRDGLVCEKCLRGSKAWGVVHRCYRGSALGSLALARMQWRAERHQIWYTTVHRFIALTNFARAKFIAGGLPADRLAVKPNFAIADAAVPETRSGALFVGRLSAEKGAATLVQAWRELGDVPLLIVGDGPERTRLEAEAPDGVKFIGHLPQTDVRKLMSKAQLLIAPSICYESFPLAVVEAFAAGLPVLAARIGSLGEIVVDGVNGRHFRPADATSLAQTAREMFSNPGLLSELGSAARATYEAKYTPATNLAQLESIYAAALEEAGRN